MKKLILASASPRRKELLRGLGLVFDVITSHLPEIREEGVPPRQVAQNLARGKACDVAGKLNDGIVIGADTLVVLDGEILGKPRDREDARRILRHLSGRIHEVITGVAVIDTASGRSLQSVGVTQVHFRELTDDEIGRYVSTGEPMDKAGAYGIQGKGILFVEGIEGCYTNVVGLPLPVLAEMLARMDLPLL
ncbi:MAG: septum formation inhibitor Maf [Deltaproteobacteria bacterium]|nr:septum formation inhibitor Maf [Deltaproteobacteria bacterium]